MELRWFGGNVNVVGDGWSKPSLTPYFIGLPEGQSNIVLLHKCVLKPLITSSGVLVCL